MLNHKKRVSAVIFGNKEHPDLHGTVMFSTTPYGVLVTAQIHNLPMQSNCKNTGVFGFHIHSGKACTGTEDDEFSNALTHFNPEDCPHPYHAGDLPPLFGNNGFAYLSFLTDRFTLEDIIGKAVIIHDRPDDFTTQPSGDSGTKIACGVIK